MAVQKIREKFSDNIESGGSSKRDDGIARNSIHAFPTSWPPNTGGCTRSEYTHDTGNGKCLSPIGVLSSYGAKNRVARPRPDTVFMGREIAVVFVKQHGSSVGDGFA